jgi:hypothetical protein
MKIQRTQVEIFDAGRGPYSHGQSFRDLSTALAWTVKECRALRGITIKVFEDHDGEDGVELVKIAEFDA